MDLSYKVKKENKENRTKTYELGCSKREVPTRSPRFRDRDKVYAVIKKIQSGDKDVKRIISAIANTRSITEDEVHAMIEKNEGLSEIEMDSINEVAAQTDITTADQETLICSILDMTAEEKEAFMDDLSIVEGVATLKLAMSIYTETMVDKEERKK